MSFAKAVRRWVMWIWPTLALGLTIIALVNRPGKCGGSRPWKRGWSHAEGTGAWKADFASYSPEEKAAAVRMVRALRSELGTEHGTVHRVARQLGYGIESVRAWVRQADIDDGYSPGVSTSEAQRIKDLEQENRELKRARF